jgi:hypothetical protein
MIPDPQRTYLLELFAALGPPAKDFILAGAQAIKFDVKEARGTKDVDFILNVIALRAESLRRSAFGVNDPRLKPCCSQQLSFPAASLWERSADRKPG